MLSVYMADVGCLCEKEIFDTAYHSVKQYRQQKIDRLWRAEDRRLSLGAELLLKTALTKQGVDYGAVDIVSGDNGKPHLRGDELFFSLSHSGEQVMCAVSDQPVGCDTQRMFPVKDQLAERFFSPQEYAALTAREDEETRRRMFYRIWTRKESYIKAIESGARIPFSMFNVLTDDVLPFHFRDYSGEDGYQSAVCAVCDVAAPLIRISNMR